MKTPAPSHMVKFEYIQSMALFSCSANCVSDERMKEFGLEREFVDNRIWGNNE